jgi:hypothetical protein
MAGEFDWAGVIFHLVLAACFAAVAYWLWPDGITDIPMARLTLGLLLKAGGTVLLGMLALASIFGAISDASN